VLACCRATRALDGYDRYGSGDDWKAFCTALAGLSAGDDAGLRRLIEAELQPVAVLGDGRAEGLFTGYYEPLVRGSRQKQGRYIVPLYRQPPDLVQVDLGEFRDSLKGQRIAGRVREGRLRPYDDRSAIEAGALANKNLELVWLDDAADAFFLQVQGSGLVQLDTGAKTRVGFAAQNGYPYVAIGRVMIERGTLAREDVSMQAIRAWLRANPDAAPELLQQNPSYVFFRELPAPKDDLDGPPGAQGVALLPGRSLAVDRSHHALGLPLWLDAQQPAPNGPGDLPLQRLMVAQDTGGAIRGAVRGDVFWGAGPQAESIAGRMKHPGRFWLLLPKAVATKLTALS
jgi:membrane-bound lytic murein transglycosylase A